MDADRVRSSASVSIADVGSECVRLGGELLTVAWRACDDAVFSAIFLRLMMFLMSSLCCRRASLLLHHMDRLYSYCRPRCLQAVHMGAPLSHFFLLSLHVKHPVLDLQCICVLVLASPPPLPAFEAVLAFAVCVAAMVADLPAPREVPLRWSRGADAILYM